MMFIPADALVIRVIVYLCAQVMRKLSTKKRSAVVFLEWYIFQAVILVAFIMIGQVTAEVVSTDTRTISFVILDGFSKVCETIN